MSMLFIHALFVILMCVSERLDRIYLIFKLKTFVVIITAGELTWVPVGRMACDYYLHHSCICLYMNAFLTDVHQ